MKQNTILLNWDGDAEWFFMDNLNGDYDNLEQKAKDYLEKYYKDCGIGDILFNIFCQNSITPSKVFTDRVTKYYQKIENGVAVDYTDNDRIRPHKISRENYGVGLTETWIEHCKKIGIRPWISIRMNDHHCPNDVTNWLRSDFFYEARANGWMLGKRGRFGSIDWNYAIEEVQQKMLEYIEEQLSVLDVYGIELDFMREPKCFKYYEDKNVYVYMNSFMEKVRAIVDKCEAIHGHPIKIAARLTRDINVSKRIGFDAEYWAKNGLVDVIIPSPHWLGADTGMPIAEWCEKLSPYGVDVYPCLEMNLPFKTYINDEVAKAHTVQYAAQGADATYVYNLYHVYFDYLHKAGEWLDTPSPEKIMNTWKSCGDIENCKKGVRRHIITEESLGFHDVMPRWNPLPKKIGYSQSFEVQTGEITPESEVTLFIGITGADPNKLTIYFNCAVCEYIGNAKDAYILQNPRIDASEIYAFSLPQNFAEPLTQIIGVAGDFNAEIYYIEIKVDAK